MTRQPTLAEQIEAVRLAAECFEEELAARPTRLRPHGWLEYRRSLAAALETLKTMEFARETLK